MDKPKGGRGNQAPYETKQMRVPVGLEPQIQELIYRYREWIARSGFHSGVGTNNPPRLLDKPVDSFNEAGEELAQLRLQLAEEQTQKNSWEDSALQWQSIAESAQEHLSAAGGRLDLEAERDLFLAGLKLGKQAPEYKRTKATIDRFIGAVGQGS